MRRQQIFFSVVATTSLSKGKKTENKVVSWDIEAWRAGGSHSDREGS